MATSKADHPVFRGEDVKPGLCEAALLTEIIPRLRALRFSRRFVINVGRCRFWIMTAGTDRPHADLF